MGSLYCNALRIDDDDDNADDDDGGADIVEIVSPILFSLRSMLRRLLRYVSVDCDELKWFVECVWLLIMLWLMPKPLCVDAGAVVKFKLLLFILLLLLLLLWLSCIVDVDVVPVDDAWWLPEIPFNKKRRIETVSLMCETPVVRANANWCKIKSQHKNDRNLLTMIVRMLPIVLMWIHSWRCDHWLVCDCCDHY